MECRLECSRYKEESWRKLSSGSIRFVGKPSGCLPVGQGISRCRGIGKKADDGHIMDRVDEQ